MDDDLNDLLEIKPPQHGMRSDRKHSSHKHKHDHRRSQTHKERSHTRSEHHGRGFRDDKLHQRSRTTDDLREKQHHRHSRRTDDLTSNGKRRDLSDTSSRKRREAPDLRENIRKRRDIMENSSIMGKRRLVEGDDTTFSARIEKNYRTDWAENEARQHRRQIAKSLEEKKKLLQHLEQKRPTDNFTECLLEQKRKRMQEEAIRLEKIKQAEASLKKRLIVQDFLSDEEEPQPNAIHDKVPETTQDSPLQPELEPNQKEPEEVDTNVDNNMETDPSGNSSSDSSDTEASSDTDSGEEEEEEKETDEKETTVTVVPTESMEDTAPNGADEEEERLEDLPPYLPGIEGCRNVEEFECLNRIEEGTYGVVYRAKDKRTNEIVALKRLKMEREKEGFPITSLREINTLLKAQHVNIVTVREIVSSSNLEKIYIVMDYVEHDLKSLMEMMKRKKQSFMPGEVKCLMLQLLRAVSHIHDNWILHRDLKTSNLLMSHTGVLKVGDFGLAREYGSPLKPYTPVVVTLWYRAPELLLGIKEYSVAIDMWSVGCIFGELLLMNPLFRGKSEYDQLLRIFKEMGTPDETVWPGYTKLPFFEKINFPEFPPGHLRSRFNQSVLTDFGLHLMYRFLTYDPTQRISADEALKHEYFKEAPMPIDPSMFPTWPAKSELGYRKAMATSPKPPSGGREYKLLGDADDSNGGFHMGGLESGQPVYGAGFSLRF